MSDNLLDLQITVRKVKYDLPCIQVQGEMDINTSPRLKKVIEQTLDEGQAHLVIDFNGVRYIDSTGLGVLVASRKRLQESNGSITVICNNRHILKLFDITGLVNLFEMYPTEEAFNDNFDPAKLGSAAGT